MIDAPVSHRDPSPFGKRVPVRGIFLVGFMGAGKTTVGQALAEMLDWRFFDLDREIETREGLSVPQIFRVHGEQEFRAREHEALRELVSKLNTSAPTVVALGGGAFVQAHNVELLSTAGPSVFLDTEVEELWQRCLDPKEPERPLRTDENAFRALYEQRRKHYMQSTLRIETAGKTIPAIAKEVVAKLDLANGSPKKESGE